MNRKLKKDLDKNLWFLTGLYNWTIKSVEWRKDARLPYSAFSLEGEVAGHSKKMGISSRAITGTINQAFNAWSRCWKQGAGRPKLKGFRNKLNSILYQGDVKLDFKKNRILVPKLGWVKFHSFSKDLPNSKIASEVRFIKKASGWYAILLYKEEYKTVVQETEDSVGIDTGFKHLAILSNGKKYEPGKELEKSLDQMAKNQRGCNKKKTARLHEKIANQRKDRNHKISNEIVKEFKEIYITNDNLKGQAKKFGKSIQSSAIGQLRKFIAYKSSSCGRKCILVDSKYSTMTCASCQSLTGPTGLRKLNVRNWVCSACGAEHDRDINAAINTLHSGARYALQTRENNGQNPSDKNSPGR